MWIQDMEDIYDDDYWMVMVTCESEKSLNVEIKCIFI